MNKPPSYHRPRGSIWRCSGCGFEGSHPQMMAHRRWTKTPDACKPSAIDPANDVAFAAAQVRADQLAEYYRDHPKAAVDDVLAPEEESDVRVVKGSWSQNVPPGPAWEATELPEPEEQPDSEALDEGADWETPLVAAASVPPELDDPEEEARRFNEARRRAEGGSFGTNGWGGPNGTNGTNGTNGHGNGHGGLPPLDGDPWALGWTDPPLPPGEFTLDAVQPDDAGVAMLTTSVEIPAAAYLYHQWAVSEGWWQGNGTLRAFIVDSLFDHWTNCWDKALGMYDRADLERDESPDLAGAVAEVMSLIERFPELGEALRAALAVPEGGKRGR